MMRLVLVDDQALVQQGVATLLEMSGVCLLYTSDAADDP